MKIKNIKYIIDDYFSFKNVKSSDKKILGCEFDRNDIYDFVYKKMNLIEDLEKNKDLEYITRNGVGSFDFDLDEINEEINLIPELEDMIYGFKNDLFDFINDNFEVDLVDKLEDEYFSDFWNNIGFDSNKISMDYFDNNSISKNKELKDLLDQIEGIELEVTDARDEYNSVPSGDDEYEKENYFRAEKLYENTKKEIEDLADDLYSDCSIFYEENQKKIDKLLEIISNLDILVEDVFEKLKEEKEDLFKSKALLNIKELEFFKNNCGIEKFSKEVEKDIVAEFGWGDESIIVFKDNSMIYKEENNYKVLENDSYTINLKNIYKNIINGYVKYKNRKNPSIKKYIEKKIKEEKKELGSIFELNDIILENRNLLKKFSVNVDCYNNQKHEKLYDKIQEIQGLNRIDVFYKKQLSGKYSVLRSEKTSKLFEKWINNGLGEDEFGEFISKKMAAILESENPINELESIMTRNMLMLTEWGEEFLENQFKKMEIDNKRIIKESGLFILKINNYEECKEIGSTSWCINRSRSFYDRYKKDNEFFILFDTSKEKNDFESVIGFHMKKENDDFKIEFSHLKNDGLTSIVKKKEIINFAEKNSDFFDSFLCKKEKSKIKKNML